MDEEAKMVGQVMSPALVLHSLQQTHAGIRRESQGQRPPKFFRAPPPSSACTCTHSYTISDGR